MPEYTVYLTQTASTAVTVDAEDYDSAVDEAFQDAPASLCAQCSGWGRSAGVELAGDWEVFEVENDHGEAVTS